MSLWRSGIFWAILGFIGGLGNLVFQIIIKRRLPGAEFGHANTLLGAIVFFGLPMQMASTAVIHYVAHFKSHNDQSRLQGLLAGCRGFLLKVTITGSFLAVILATPFGHFFGYSPGEMFAAILCVLVGLWSSFAIALCQGMSWFKRLAVIGFVAVLLRLLFGWLATGIFPTAKVAVSATTFSLFANLALLFWWKSIFRHDAEKVSPWNREFFGFLVVAAGFVAGNFFFMQGDMLAAQRHFTVTDLNFYATAGVLARAVPATVSPLLNVFFTSRSGRRSDQSSKDQKILLVLYGLGLACGAAGLITFRNPFLKILGKYSPQSAVLIPRYALTLALCGLNQAIGTWSLASRWFKIALLYGGLGLAYWIILLTIGHDPAKMLNTMLIASAASFVILCAVWLNTLRSNSMVPAQP
jgi:O-antigen/teichoic acid export membrane protein